MLNKIKRNVGQLLLDQPSVSTKQIAVSPKMSLLFPIFAVTFDTNGPISLSYEGGYQFPLILIARLAFAVLDIS
jgi:hypothetical protein